MTTQNECDKFHDVTNTNFYPLRPFSKYVEDEFENRKLNRNLSYDEKLRDTTRSAWCRVTSLANVSIKDGSENCGFVLYNNEGFDKIYGFDNKLNNYQSLGRDRSGKEHTLDVNLDYQSLKTPSPGLTEMTSENIGGDGGKFRNMSLKIKCNDKFQLEYLTPYFLTPGITVLVEWGWDSINDKGSDLLVDLNPQKDEIYELVNSWDKWESKRCKSNGRYDIFIGIITKFEYALEDSKTFNCNIELKSLAEQIYAYETDQEQSYASDTSKDDAKKLTKKFDKFLETSINFVEPTITTFRRNVKEGRLYGDPDDSYIPYEPLFINNQFGAFSYDSFDKFDTNLNRANIPKDTKWITFGFFIDMINRHASKTHKSPKSDDSIVFNITPSDICGHPNLKSNSKDVLIPNAKCPAWATTGDDIERMMDQLGEFKAAESQYTKSATEALTKMKGSLATKDSGKSGVELYDIEMFDVARFNLAKILSGKVPQNKFDIQFPIYDKTYKGYGGKLSSIYISDALIKRVFKNNQSLRSMVQQVLDTMSQAASGIWDFDIVDISSGVLTIIDRNYPGTREGQGIVRVDQLMKELYTFSTMDANSVVTNLSFNANLPDSVAFQTLFNSKDSLISNRSGDIFRLENSSRSGAKIRIEDRYSRFGGNNRIVEPGPTTNDGIYARQDGDYIKLEVDPSGFRKNFDIRLTEANEEVAKQGIYNDNSANNVGVFNRVVPGVTVTFETVGISGVRFMDCFKVDSLPYPYDSEVVYQVKQVKHILSGNDWKTIVESAIRPSPILLGADKS